MQQAGLLAVVCGQGLATAAVAVASKKNLNSSKPREQSKCLGGNIGCKVCSSSLVFPSTTADFDGNLCIYVLVGCGSGWCNKASEGYNLQKNCLHSTSPDRNFAVNCLKKNQNAPRPSEHPPVWRKKCQNV